MNHPLMIRCILPFSILTITVSAQYAKRESAGLSETKGLGWESYPKQQDRIFSLQKSQSSGRILHYQLDLNFTEGLTNNNHFYSGRERITWKPDGDSLIILDAINLRIDSVLAENQRLNFDTQSTSGKLKLLLPASVRSRDSIFLDIWYAHTSSENRGYYFYDTTTVGTLKRLAYTFTEPYDSPYWFPCINDPSVKVPCRISVTVPVGYLAASNGLLKQTVDNGDGTVTFRWEERYPVAMYLMAVTISKYSTFSHYYRRVSNPSDSIEIKYYIWQADSAGQTYSAVRAFRNVLNMMTIFSTIFGEYPYEKYGMAAVFPFGAGGMEHQTMTTIHRNWISGDGSQGGIAHELAHQWWGDMVTCATWADIWLNEGFATYSEAMWEENFYGLQTFRTLMRNKQVFTNVTSQYAIYNPPTQHLFDTPLIYNKGAWVLHMLRYVVGDSTFLKILTEYRKRFEHESATTNDFARVASDVAGVDLAWFFNQWVYRKGWPVYAYNWSAQPLLGGGSNVTVTIQQHQSDDVFQMPIPLTVRMGGMDTTFIANNITRTQTFQFSAPFSPDSVLFDRDGWILKQMSGRPVSVSEDESALPKAFVLYQNYPNPFNPATLIRYELPVGGHVVLKVYNLLAQEVSVLVNRVQPAGHYEVSFDGTTLTSGIYFYRLSVAPSTGEKTGFIETKKMVLIK